MKKILSTTLSLSILLAALGLTSSEDIKDEEVYKIGFGSCLTEKREQPIWQAIKKEELNEFFFMGDNVYGDNEDTGLDGCFDLFEDPKKVLEMNKSEIYAFLENSPKKIRKIKLNKSPILLDVEMNKIPDEYNIVSDDILLDRNNFIEFKKKL